MQDRTQKIIKELKLKKKAFKKALKRIQSSHILYTTFKMRTTIDILLGNDKVAVKHTYTEEQIIQELHIVKTMIEFFKSDLS